MTNIKMETSGNILKIEIDLTKTFGMSKTQKTWVVASTEGFVPVGSGIILNLNANKAK